MICFCILFLGKKAHIHRLSENIFVGPLKQIHGLMVFRLKIKNPDIRGHIFNMITCAFKNMNHLMSFCLQTECTKYRPEYPGRICFSIMKIRVFRFFFFFLRLFYKFRLYWLCSYPCGQKNKLSNLQYS